MRLLKRGPHGEVSLTKDLIDNIPAYAILSHTWGADEDEVTFDDIEKGKINNKPGYEKIKFCAEQAQNHNLEYYWIDTCCIDKANHAELSEAITSMFRWYQNAAKCYVYLADVSAASDSNNPSERVWEASFCKSRWFRRGWTLQELLAPTSVDFFSREGTYLGSKKTLEALVYRVTGIPITALQGKALTHFSVDERLNWTVGRDTKRPEDKAYCLLGIFNIFMPLIYGEGDNAFLRLKDEISKQARNSASSSVHVHWLVPRSPNPLFTGRESILQELSDKVKEAVRYPPAYTQCRIVITGIGGQGKSELCLQLACRLREWFWAVIWIDVSTRDIAERSILDAARKLSLPAQSWEDARGSIANLKHPWLLVLDNADNPEEDYQQYFPEATLGVVMLSSRNEECQQYATSKAITLVGLEDEEAKDLLFESARVSPNRRSALQEDTQVLISLLQSHALALIQAGAYIARGHCTFASYPRIYEQQRRRLLTFRPTQAQSRYRDVYATFEVSAKVLQTSETKVAQDALQLLPHLAVCGPRRLPLISLFEAAWRGAKSVPENMDAEGEDENVWLLTPWHTKRLPLLVQVKQTNWDSYQLVEAVQLLKAFSLVSADFQDGQLSVSMHPLIHAWARDRQDDQQRHENWLQMGCLIAVGSLDQDTWEQLEPQLQPHIEALVAWETEAIFGQDLARMVARILARASDILERLRSDTSAFELIQRIFAHLSLNERVVQGPWLGLYYIAGVNLVRVGKAQEAAAILEQVVEIQEQTLAADDPYRLTSQHVLAIAYQANGQVKEAVAILEEVLKIREQTLDADHPYRLASQHALAGAYTDNGQIKEAVAMLEQVVKIREQTLAAEHPERLASQHALALAYRENGQVKEAVAMLEEVVKLKEQTLAADHSSRLASQHALAVALWDDGKYDSALSMMTRVVEICQRVLPSGHRERQISEDFLQYFKDNAK